MNDGEVDRLPNGVKSLLLTIKPMNDGEVDQLPNTKHREYKEVEDSLKYWINWEWASKVKRLQQLGLTENWYLNSAIDIWLKEAKNCYIFGFHHASIFFSGATLELAMKIHMKTWKKPKKFKDFNELINLFHKEGLLSNNEKAMAHELKKMRNNYGHGDINKLAQQAVKDGIKVEVSNLIISNIDSSGMPDMEKQIITEPNDEDMKLIFSNFNAEKLAWKSLKNLITILLKLFPPNDKDITNNVIMEEVEGNV